MRQIFLFLVLSLLTISCSKNTLLPSPVVALKYQNFVYRGIDNELEIVVPGAKSFKVIAPGLTEQGSGKYKWNVTQITTNTLDFEIVTDKDSIFHIKKEFYIRNIPKMTANLNGRGCENCIIELSKNDLKDVRIGVSYDPYVDIRVRPMVVKEYTLILPEGYEYKVYENTFSNSAQKMIAQYPSGTIFKIKDIIYSFHGYEPPKAELKFMLVD